MSSGFTQSLCRICLKDSWSYSNIFEERLMDETLLMEVVNDTCQLDIYFGDGLPPFLCCKCYSKISEFELFRRQAHEIKAVLLSLDDDSEINLEDIFPSTSSTFHCVNKLRKRKRSSMGEEGSRHSSESHQQLKNVQETRYKSNEDDFAGNMDHDPLFDLAETPLVPEACRSNLKKSDRLKKLLVKDKPLEVERISSQRHTFVPENPQDGITPYKCHVCRLEFSEYESFNYHRMQHLKDRLHLCKHCNKSFVMLSRLKEHEKIHEFDVGLVAVDSDNSSIPKQSKTFRKRSFKCDSCDMTFFSKTWLKVHNRSHAAQKQHKCTACNEYFQDINLLDRHMRTHVHSMALEVCPETAPDASYTCGISGNVFSSQETRTEREKMHEEDVCASDSSFYSKVSITGEAETNENGTYASDNCNDNFRSRETLSERKKTNEECANVGANPFSDQVSLPGRIKTTDSDSYTCDISNKNSPNLESLSEHAKTDLQVDSYECLMCKIKFTDFQSFDSHGKRHLKEMKHKCSVCNKAFRSLDLLNDHSETHKLDRKKDSACRMSPKIVIQVNPKKANRRGRKVSSCDICGRSFMDKHRLVCHIRTHTNERPYVCEFCGKAFSQSASLLVHRRIHTKERPVKCNECEKAFGSHSSLRSHKITAHMKEKPFVCEVCQKSFSRKSSCVAHKRIHTGLKPYQCQYCDKCFTDRGVLKKHTMLHTGHRPHKCDYCERRFITTFNKKVHMKVHQKKGM